MNKCITECEKKYCKKNLCDHEYWICAASCGDELAALLVALDAV